MTRIRRHARTRHRALPLLLLAILLARLVAPAGFMPAIGASGFAIVPCSGHGVLALAPSAHHHMGHEAHAGHPDHAGHGKGGSSHADAPCGFGGLALPGLAGADPLQLALALAFIVATAVFLAPLPLARRAARWRPPLRAPPLPA